MKRYLRLIELADDMGNPKYVCEACLKKILDWETLDAIEKGTCDICKKHKNYLPFGGKFERMA